MDLYNIHTPTFRVVTHQLRHADLMFLIPFIFLRDSETEGHTDHARILTLPKK